jgi:choline-phosphate cytidylyltransferase
MTIVITFGTFDLFHIGHLNILKRAKSYGNKLIVGISSDDFNKIKGKQAIYNHNDRLNIVSSIKYVDSVFLEESFEKKREYILENNADILIMGDDWKDKFNEFNDICKVIYIERTPDISTTEIKEFISSQ